MSVEALRSVKGVFWLPESPDDLVAGELVIDTDGNATLDLIGSLGGLESLGSGGTVFERVLGAAGNKEYTLTTCQETRTSVHFPGAMQQTLRPRVVFEGAHLLEGDLRFDRCEISIAGLAQWVGRSGATVELKRNDSGTTGATVDFTSVQPLESPFSAGTLSVWFGWTLGGDHVSRTELIQSCTLAARFSEPSELEHVLAVAGAVQDLLAVALGDGCRIDNVSVRSAAATRVLQDGSTLQLPLKVFVAYPVSPGARAVSAHDFAFRFDDVGGIDGVARWIDVAQKHRSALALLRTTRSPGIPYQELRYLNVLMAAEWFDRATEDNFVLPKSEFKAKRRAILDSVPSDVRSWLEETLNSANEPRLTRRLERLVEGLGEEGRLLVPDASRWARACSKLRNQLVHSDGTSAASAAAAPLLFLARSVHYAVVARLLAEAGAGSTAVKALLQSRDCQWVSSRLEESLVAVESLPRR